jgi:hypothetical protein
VPFTLFFFLVFLIIFLKVFFLNLELFIIDFGICSWLRLFDLLIISIQLHILLSLPHVIFLNIISFIHLYQFNLKEIS